MTGLEGAGEVAGEYEGEGGAASSDGAPRVGPDAAVGEGVYAGGGSLEGTVNAFMPGRSGRLVAGDGFARGLGLLRGGSVLTGARSTGPLKLGAAGV